MKTARNRIHEVTISPKTKTIHVIGIDSTNPAVEPRQCFNQWLQRIKPTK
jgi:hypothetical protein